jgi:hypothetical protein
MTNQFINSKTIRLLQFLTFSIFIGRAYQFIFFDIPFRSLFWDENLMTSIVQLFDLSWNDYINNLEIARTQESMIQVIGGFLVFAAIATFFSHYNKKWLNRFLSFGSFILLCLSLLYWKEHFYYFGQLIEYSIQWTTPILLVLFINYQNRKEKFHQFVLITKIVIALTFIGHGLYAFGVYPVPGNFVQMCLDVFLLDDFQATLFLKTVGILDFIAAALLFIPKVDKVGIWYCIIWGFLTAFARIIANFDINIPWLSLHQWLWETIVRLSHGGIPLVLLRSMKLQIST